MTTILADSFTAALGKLANNEQKQAQLTAFTLMTEPDRPGLKYHRIDSSKDPNFWSVRVSRDVRIIVHRDGASLMLAFVGHHDDAYAWAERRRIETHPRTRAIQIVEVRERVEEPARLQMSFQHEESSSRDLGPGDRPVREVKGPMLVRPFARLSQDDLLSVGVPEDWLGDVRVASEDAFFDLAGHLPQEASEALLEYAATGVLAPAAEPAAEALEHPDSQRRFRVLDNVDELRAALEAPFEKWTVFLHPSQREVVERRFDGPARVAGSAGTGKTVVALHRVARLLRASPESRVLLTTFSEPLARALRGKLALLAGGAEATERVSIGSFSAIARELLALATGKQPHLAGEDVIRSLLSRVASETGIDGFSPRFLVSEWTNVIDAWQLPTLEAYTEVPRMGRKNRLSARQREAIWQVATQVRDRLAKRGLLTEAQLFAATADAYRDREHRPYDHIVVDEAQDLGVAELRFLAAIAPDGRDALFFSGDLGQRIFRQPFSWLGLGIDVRGRSKVLKVNYRTSHQIRRMADQLLPPRLRDVDGLEDDRTGTVSIFDGPEPDITVARTEAEEVGAAAGFLARALADGVAPAEIGIFVRTADLLGRARDAARSAALPTRELLDADTENAALLGVMHLAKGLEFRAVLLMGCDEGILPLAERVDDIADEFELDEVLLNERQLFYVAATRARDRLCITATEPASEFLDDLHSQAE